VRRETVSGLTIQMTESILVGFRVVQRGDIVGLAIWALTSPKPTTMTPDNTKRVLPVETRAIHVCAGSCFMSINIQRAPGRFRWWWF